MTTVTERVKQNDVLEKALLRNVDCKASATKSATPLHALVRIDLTKFCTGLRQILFNLAFT